MVNIPSSLPVSMKRNLSNAIKEKYRFPKINMGFFSDAQGQLTVQSVVGFGPTSNSFELLCMSLLSVNL